MASQGKIQVNHELIRGMEKLSKLHAIGKILEDMADAVSLGDVKAIAGFAPKLEELSKEVEVPELMGISDRITSITAEAFAGSGAAVKRQGEDQDQAPDRVDLNTNGKEYLIKCKDVLERGIPLYLRTVGAFAYIATSTEE